MPLRKFNDGQEIVMEDFNDLSKSVLKDIYDRGLFEVLQRTENAFFDDSLQIVFSNNINVICKKGLGFQTDAMAVSPNLKRKPVVLSGDKVLSVVPANAINDRIDLICVKSSISDELTGQRNYKDATDGSVSLQGFVLQTDWDSEFVVVEGVPAAVPAIPVVPPGYIKLAEVLVKAVVGIENANAITDKRTKMPVGGEILLTTTGFQRLTAGASTNISKLFSEIDSFLKFGYFNYFDFDVLGAHPANPAANKRRVYALGDVLYQKKNDGTIVPVGSGTGGGGGGANWQPVEGSAPFSAIEYNEKVLLFSTGEDQRAVLFVKVPTGYLAGRQIKMNIGFFSPSAANNLKLQCTSTLVRKGTDAIDSAANTKVTDTGNIVNAVAKQYKEANFDLTDGTGKVNGFAVSPGDILKLEITRIAPSIGVDDVEDIRVIPSSTEVLF